MSNPWEEIDLKDYESHMSLADVYQLQGMNEMMKEQFYTYGVRSLMILGVAGGNGLEHIAKASFQAVYGVDINQCYLEECRTRYKALEGILHTICTDLTCGDLLLPHADLLIANLLIEYIGYECFQRVVKMVAPQYVSCIIQVNTDASFVSDSPYLHVFERLEEVHHTIGKEGLFRCMEEIGYRKGTVLERPLPNGKKLVRMDFLV